MSGIYPLIQGESESNVERDGIITLIQRSRGKIGIRISKYYCILLIGPWAIGGQRLPSIFMAELIMALKIIGIPP